MRILSPVLQSTAAARHREFRLFAFLTFPPVETTAHQRLKCFAFRLLRQWGCAAFAEEVRCPASRFRVDVAGYLDRTPSGDQRRPWKPCAPRTIIVECKQCRSDFLRDARKLEMLLRHRERMLSIRESIEHNHLRSETAVRASCASALFPEFDDWDYSQAELPAYHKVRGKIEQLESRIYGETKFSHMARYHVADALFIAAPRGMLRPRELPTGWGLLECPEVWLNCAAEEEADLFEPLRTLTVRTEAPRHETRAEFRQRLLRNIAVAGTRMIVRRDIPIGLA